MSKQILLPSAAGDDSLDGLPELCDESCPNPQVSISIGVLLLGLVTHPTQVSHLVPSGMRDAARLLISSAS